MNLHNLYIGLAGSLQRAATVRFSESMLCIPVLVCFSTASSERQVWYVTHFHQIQGAEAAVDQ